MSLPDDYLTYPKRRHGMDHDLYPWSNLLDRAPIAWPGGARVALMVMPLVEYFPLVARDTPFKAPGHMATPYPDLRHYSSRDYGTRVGLFRFLDAFDALGVKATVAMNAAIADRYPFVAREVAAAGHEIVAHSTDMNGLQYGGMDQAEERRLIGDTLDTLERVAGTRPRGWRSVAQSESENTLMLLAEHGVDYVCDWVNDELPYPMSPGQMTGGGRTITALPVNHEISDRQIFVTCQHSQDAFVAQLQDQVKLLSKEADTYGGRMMTLTLTPYITGLPYRIRCLKEALSFIMDQEGVWSATGSEIIDAAARQKV